MLIFGTRTAVQVLVMARFLCRYCGVTAAQRVSTRRTRFTLFFIPLFTTSQHWLIDCVNCGASTPVPKEVAESHLVAAAR